MDEIQDILSRQLLLSQDIKEQILIAPKEKWKPLLEMLHKIDKVQTKIFNSVLKKHPHFFKDLLQDKMHDFRIKEAQKELALHHDEIADAEKMLAQQLNQL